MAHGLPSGYVRLYDEHGNAVDVSVQPSGRYALATADERVLLALKDIRAKLDKPEKTNPWAVSTSPWKGLS